MKNQIFKLFLLLLTTVLILSTAVGCSKEESKDSETTTSEEPIPVKEEAHIAVSELKDYVLVIPQDVGEEVTQAVARLRTAMEEHFDVTTTVVSDEYRFFAKDKVVKPCEILIGRTNREETTAFLKTISYGEAGVSLIGKKLVVCGSTEALTAQMVDSLIGQMQAGDVFYSNQKDCIVKSDTTIPKKDHDVAGIPLSDFAIVYTDSDIYPEVDRFYHEIGEATGVCLPVVSTTILDSKNPIPAILFGSAEKVDKNLAKSVTYAFDEYGYSIKQLGGVPQVIADGPSQYALFLSGQEFARQLSDQTEMKMDTDYRASAVEGAYEAPVQKDHPVDGVKLAGGDLSQYRIVYAEEETGKTAFAAQELASYLEKATGISVPVVPDSEDAVNDNEIVVGITNRDTENVKTRRAKLENDGIIYYMEGNRLFLTSHTDAGQIYAVYHFLEEKIGCRFYTTEYEVIQPSGVIEIPANLDYSYSSPLFYRHTSWANASMSLRRKLSCVEGEDIMYSIVGWCHTLGELSETGNGWADNPCLCDEEIYQTVLKNVRARIEANPGCRVISVTQDDTNKRCQCEKCLAMEEAENPSGLMLTFVNRIADDIKDDYPDVKVLTFAYQYTRKPPKTVKARDNVMIWLCSIECCFNHTLDDPDCEQNREFVEDIEAWADYCKTVYIWDYTTDYARYTYTYPNLMVLRDNLRFFVDHGALGIYEQGNSQDYENGEFSHLRRYLLGHLMWNPYMTEDEYQAMMNEFLEAYYGAGWRAIRYYIDLTCYSLKNCLSTFEWISTESYNADPDAMEECFRYAIEAAQDEITKRHCEVSALQMECLKVVEGPEELSEELKHKLYDAGVRYYGEGSPITFEENE